MSRRPGRPLRSGSGAAGTAASTTQRKPLSSAATWTRSHAGRPPREGGSRRVGAVDPWWGGTGKAGGTRESSVPGGAGQAGGTRQGLSPIRGRGAATRGIRRDGSVLVVRRQARSTVCRRAHEARQMASPVGIRRASHALQEAPRWSVVGGADGWDETTLLGRPSEMDGDLVGRVKQAECQSLMEFGVFHTPYGIPTI